MRTVQHNLDPWVCPQRIRRCFRVKWDKGFLHVGWLCSMGRPKTYLPYLRYLTYLQMGLLSRWQDQVIMRSR
ncbi:hypothetical protein VTK73DRAFT_10304 [Phialemonium thermophilum]|uniref:Uncharacterized protein n=1 Tax=Phialemonium thermophilum TaxID=223376 RepID=A0ABR3VXH3_9PEZI